MPRAERQRLRESDGPVVFGILRKAVDQVEADAFEILLRSSECSETLVRRMGAAEKRQRVVIEALKAQ